MCVPSLDFMFIAIGGEMENTWIVLYSFVGFSDGSGANFYPLSENPTEAYFGFLTQNRFILAGNSARLLKNTIGTKANRNISLRRKIRRRIKKFFTHPGKRFFGSATLFLSDSVQKIRQ